MQHNVVRLICTIMSSALLYHVSTASKLPSHVASSSKWTTPERINIWFVLHYNVYDIIHIIFKPPLTINKSILFSSVFS